MITNKINKKQYVGQTIGTLKKRWQRHCWACAIKSRMPICFAIKKYGKENFSMEPIEEGIASQKELDDAEIKYARSFNTFAPNGYNLRAGNGRGSVSEITRRKISKALKGQKRTEEQKRRLSEAHKGIPLPESAKRKLSKLYKGRRLPELAYTNSAKAQSKKYKLFSPDGEMFIVDNMKIHCLKYNLLTSGMSLVVNNKQNHHHGWTGTIIE